MKDLTGYHDSDFYRNLQGLSTGLTNTWDKKNGSRYSQATLPAWSSVHETVVNAIEEVLDTEWINELRDSDFAWKVQALLVLGLQICMPPMRGKPFWDLQMTAVPATSMNGIL